jgi:hypothetical protein
VHGIAGIGKSALVRAFAHDARGRGVRVLELDCREVEPTARGFLDALGSALDHPLGSEREAAAALAGLPGRTVLVLDPYERIGLLDAWLRLRLVPVLPGDVRLLLAGRDPAAAWIREFGDSVRVLPLGGLAAADAMRVLERSGVEDAALAARVNRFAHGHPLALQLAAGALAARPELARVDAGAGSVVAQLAELYLAGLDAPTRRAFDAACTVRRATVSLLGAVLAEDAPGEAFEALRRLPFVAVDLAGLEVQETVREAGAALLRAADPATYRRLRTAAWRQLRAELRDAESSQLWRYTADMLHLVEHPAVRDAFFPASAPRFAVEPARPEDRPAVEAIARARAAEEPATLRAYLDGALGAFRVVRDAGGGVAAYACVLDPETVPAALLSADPLARAWREHRRRDPVPRGQKALYVRDCRVGAAHDPAPASAALWLDLKRDYLELRPALCRVYVAAEHPDAVMPALAPLGFARLDLPPVAVDGLDFATLLNDMGPASVDGWLGAVVGRELQAAEEGVLDPARRELVVDGARVPLTRLEFDLLRYLQAHEGQAVARDRLLRDVWGHDWTGGSNVIETVVSGVRRTLGPHAAALETVRGVGYRLRRLA